MFVVVTVVVVVIVVGILVCHCQWVWDFNCDCMSVSWPNASPASRQLTRTGSLTLHLPYYHSLPLLLPLPVSLCLQSHPQYQIAAITRNPQSAIRVHCSLCWGRKWSRMTTMMVMMMMITTIAHIGSVISIYNSNSICVLFWNMWQAVSF